MYYWAIYNSNNDLKIVPTYTEAGRPTNSVCLVPEPIIHKAIKIENGEAVYDPALQQMWDSAEAAQTTLDAWQDLRDLRDQKLRQSDFTQLSDAPLTFEEKSDWGTYRALLRSLPDNTSDPLNPIWPTEPGA